jgi:hypothetical protein
MKPFDRLHGLPNLLDGHPLVSFRDSYERLQMVSGSDYYVEEIRKWDALGAAVGALLPQYKPPFWRSYRLKAKREWTLQCIHYMWPQWFDEAIKCGIPEEVLVGVSMMILDADPRKYSRIHNK